MEKIYPATLFKRLIALIIDLVILLLIGMTLSIFLGNWIMYLGKLKILIGIVISTLYFGFGHSKLMKGQTIGKKIMKINVIKMNGEYLPIYAAFVRSAIFSIPYCFSNLQNIGFNTSINIWQWLSYTLIPASLFINHICVFTNINRQCFYDLLFDTIVTETNPEEDFHEAILNPKMKLLPIALIMVMTLLGLAFFNPFDEQNMNDQEELSFISEKLSSNKNLNLSKLYYEYNEKDNFSKLLRIDCYVPDTDKDLSSELYLLTEELGPFKEKFQIRSIKLSMVRDFNIGIYTHWEKVRNKSKVMEFEL